LGECVLAVDLLFKTKAQVVAGLKLDFLVHVAMRSATYAFFKTWWKGVHNYISEVTFVSADIPAYACLDSGVGNVSYWQHGLLRRSVLMPKFDVFNLITSEEKNYYQGIFEESNILVENKKACVTNHQKVLLISSCYETVNFQKKNYLEEIKELCQWAAGFNLRVVVRKHPRENDDFWETLFPEAEVEKSESTFEEILRHVKPMIMVTWFSTTLIDAFLHHVVPVSISSRNDRNVLDLIVNLTDYCYSWIDDRDVLDKLVDGQITVAECIEVLMANERKYD
jgi:hypothetical protein